MPYSTDMVANRFADRVNMVIHREVFVECHTKNYLVCQRNLSGSIVDGSKIGVAGSPLTGAKYDGFRFVWV